MGFHAAKPEKRSRGANRSSAPRDEREIYLKSAVAAAVVIAVTIAIPVTAATVVVIVIAVFVAASAVAVAAADVLKYNVYTAAAVFNKAGRLPDANTEKAATAAVIAAHMRASL